MSLTPLFLVLFTIAFSCIAIVIGGLLIKRGFWPKRRGSEPQCRGCGYSLIGLVSQRCPECGVTISALNILHGRRQRRMGPGLTGVVVVLVGIAVLIPVGMGNISQIQWYHLKPAFMVMRDLRSPVLSTADRAIIELDRRDQAGDLSPSYRQQLLEMALVQQATSSQSQVASKLIELFELHYIAGDLTDQQKQLFGEQCYNLSLRIRPTVVAGDWLPFMIDEKCRVVGPLMFVRLAYADKIAVDGNVVQEESHGGGGGSGLGAGGSAGSSILAPLPGKHEITICTRIELHRDPWGGTDPKDLLFTTEKKLTGTFVVVPPSAAPPVALTNDPTIRARLQASIVPTKFTVGTKQPTALQGSISVTGVPANVAFDLLIRVNGREVKLNALTANKGGKCSYMVGGTLRGVSLNNKPATIDLILRRSEKAARETVDLVEIWDGELIYPNIPLSVDPSR